MSEVSTLAPWGRVWMESHHYLYGRTRYLTHPDVLSQLGAIHRHHAAAQARTLGLMNAGARASWTHPDLDRMLYADGTAAHPACCHPLRSEHRSTPT